MVSPSGQPPAQALLYTATALPVASILGMDNTNGRRPPRPINVVPTFHSTLSQDTSRYFSTSTEETTNRSDSRAFFIEETILCAFRERLASKDERVAELEKKLVEMSFSSLEPGGGFRPVAAMQTLLRLLLSKLTQLFVSF